MDISTPPLPPASHGKLASLPGGFANDRLRGLERVLLVVAGILALYAAIGFLVVPRIVKSKIESIAEAELGRKASVGKVEFNPFSLRARVTDFRLADRDPRRALLRFDAMDVNVSSESLWRRAPVFDAVRLVRPRVELARDANGRLSIVDLIERPSSAPSQEPTFAINNIEIEDGSIALDDAVHGRRIELTRLAVGIPFLSSFARDTQIRVKPHLQGVIDGAPFALTGTSTSPFEEIQRATLDVNLDALALTRLADYLPLPAGVKLADGALTTRLTIAFLTWKGTPRGIRLWGSMRIDHLALRRNDASPLASAGSVEVSLANLDPVAHRASVDRVAIAAPEVDLRRLRDGGLEIPRLLAPPAKGEASASRKWAWSLAEGSISGGTVDVSDESVAPAFRTRLSGLTVAAKDLVSDGVAGSARLAFETEDGAKFDARTQVDVAAGSAQGRFVVSGLPLAKLRPYYTGMLAVDVRSGSLDAAGRFDATAARFALLEGSAIASDVDLAVEGEREPLWRMTRLEAKGIALDSTRRAATIDNLEVRRPELRVLRDADGKLHAERILRARGSAQEGAASEGTANEAEWRLIVHRLLLDGMGAYFEDRSVSPPVELRMGDARIEAGNVDTAPGSEATVDLDARIGGKGRVRLEGTTSARPLAGELDVDASGLDLLPLRGYFQSRTNAIVTSGAVNARGRVTYALGGTSGPAARYTGNVIVSDFGALDRPGSSELVRWKTLALTGTDVTVTPFQAQMDAITVDRFYARLILDADAKLNVVQVLAPPGSSEPASPKAAGISKPAPPAAPGNPIPVSIGRIQLTNGEVQFSDFYVKPNYTAHLTRVNGSVSALSPTRAGNVDVTARVEQSAPVEIRGTANPFAREIALDMTGKASDVDLPPFTPYSVKYAGYGIQNGKLSMEVHYKIDNRKLAASNKLVLNQLTFGERVESPTATKLPVLLLVALLKDRDGVIQLDLPISGTIDDPKFSMGRIVVQIIVNLLTKAATAPFALLGAIVGGGEQLAYLEFPPGQAVLTPAAEAKLASLSKALVERPGIRIDVAGRAIPDLDGEGLRRAALDREIRIRKQRDIAQAGGSAPPLEELTVGAADYAKYLKPIYRDAKLPGKPRNFIGMQKDIPAEEMEKRLLAGYEVDESALRELANRRAQAARQWFTTKGNVPADRVFVVAPKVGAEGLKGEGSPTRVDFAIK